MTNSEYIPVRLSHLLRHSSVGAIVRGTGEPSRMMVVEDIRKWTDNAGRPGGEPLRYVEGVKGALGITSELRTPPVARLRRDGSVEGVCLPASPFPTWMRCPLCGLLVKPPRHDHVGDQPPTCPRCEKRQPLTQVTMVMAHEAGHLADVPWHFLAHREARNLEQKNCRADPQSPCLHLLEPGSGQRHHRLACQRCRASATFDPSLPVPFGNNPIQPWLADRADLHEGAPSALILEVSDARIHSPVTQSALVIPPESRVPRGTVVDRLYCSSEWMRNLAGTRCELEHRSTLMRAADHFACTIDEIHAALAAIQRGYPPVGTPCTPAELLAREWGALGSPIPDNRDDEDLVTDHHTGEWRSLAGEPAPGSHAARVLAAVDQLVAIRRLKEIQVFKGFTRIKQERVVPPDIAGTGDWLPAIELFGEGIFFTLAEALLAPWENHPAVRQRARTMHKRFAASARSFHPEVHVSPRFLLLHTLSHLLIRELEAHAGYPAASLKERIYSSNTPDGAMAGILVYVAVPDVAGSLGGLAELADPRRFLRLLANAFEHARWCSLDPVCSEHDGQGPGLLNRAACHACALIPEPGCVCGNLLLDRCFLKGDPGADPGPMPALLDCLDSTPQAAP